MRIGDVYRPVVFGCWSDECLRDVARRMVEREIGVLAVLDGNRVTGVISERDLVRALAESAEPGSAKAAEYASLDVETADVEEDSRAVADRMLEAGFRHMPVIQEGEMVGMVSMRDLLALETWGR